MLVVGAFAAHADAQALSAKARESGCVDKPRLVEGSTYRCSTASGAAAYFNVPGMDRSPADPAARRPPPAASTPTPASFPRVDVETQKGRDDVRRKVLADELAAEEKMLAEARTAYANGAPAALPDEQSNAQKYAERIAKLRQGVQLHERNIDALKKELGSVR